MTGIVGKVHLTFKFWESACAGVGAIYIVHNLADKIIRNKSTVLTLFPQKIGMLIVRSALNNGWWIFIIKENVSEGRLIL